MKYTVFASALIEGVLREDQVFIRLDNDTEDKLVKDIGDYISSKKKSNIILSLGNKIFDTLVDKILLVLKDKTSQTPGWNITDVADGNGDGSYKPNFIIVDTGEDKGKDIDLQEYFSCIIPPGKQFQVNKKMHLLELVIADNGSYISFCIDPGIVIGNGYNILANIPDDTIFVNLKHRKIVSEVINDKAYILTPEEIFTARNDMFMNDAIYRSIDMSGMSGNISRLTKEEFSKLGKKLTCILNIGDIAIHNQVPRMRFTSFKDINSFELASDYACVSPLDGVSSTEIHEGLTVSVEDDTITVGLDNGEDSASYTIEQYGLM